LSDGLVLGLDVGGSRSRACLGEAGRVLAEGEAGSANPASAGESEAEAVLGGLLQEVLSGRTVQAAVAGVAGADSQDALESYAAIMRRLLPGATVEVVHDTRLVLAAAGFDAGIALVAGTGSAAYARSVSGAEVRAGGWGHRLGDEGSGYWVAREAVRRVLADADAGRQPGPLVEALGGGSSPYDLVRAFHSAAPPATWAAKAPALLAADVSLVEAAADSLAELVEVVRRRSGVRGPVVLSGGLLLGVAELETAVKARVGGEAMRLAHPPVTGAVRLALALPGSGTSR
jgi:glucosamine kinase